MSHSSSLLAMLGRVPSGIYILTVRNPADGADEQTGMLSSWVMQAGFEPPMISVAVKQGRYVADWLDAGAPFALNLVSEAGAKPLLKHFGRGFEPGEEAFAGLEVKPGPHDVPLLASHVVGHLICRPTAHIDSGDHRIYLAEALAGELLADLLPMIHVRKNGGHY